MELHNFYFQHQDLQDENDTLPLKVLLFTRFIIGSSMLATATKSK